MPYSKTGTHAPFYAAANIVFHVVPFKMVTEFPFDSYLLPKSVHYVASGLLADPRLSSAV